MAVQLFAHARGLFATAALDWTAELIQCSLLATDYVPDTELLRFYSDLPVGASVMTARARNNRMVGGAAYCAPVGFTAIPVGVGGFILWADRRQVLQLSPLIVHGTFDVPWRPTEQEADYIISWDAQFGGVFRL